MTTATNYYMNTLATDSVAPSATVTGVLSGARLILYTNNPALNNNTVLADLTQPSFPGYAAVSLAWSAPTFTLDNNMTSNSQIASFQMSDDTTPTDVTGWALKDAAGTHLLVAGTLPTKHLTSSLQALRVVVSAKIGSNFPGGVNEIESCRPPWIMCQVCGEEYPIHMIEDQVCDKCRKEQEEKQVDRVNN